MLPELKNHSKLFINFSLGDATTTPLISQKKTTCWIVCLSLLMILCKRMFRTSVYESKIIYENIYILNALSGVIVFFSLLFDWHMKFWIKTILSWGVIARCCTAYAKYHVWVTLKIYFFNTTTNIYLVQNIFSLRENFNFWTFAYLTAGGFFLFDGHRIINKILLWRLSPFGVCVCVLFFLGCE